MLKNRASLQIQCKNCSVKNLCLPSNLKPDEVDQVNNIITYSKVVMKGEHLFHSSEQMQYIFAVYSGSCKDYWLDENGNERINNFYLPGDLIGLEFIPDRKYLSSAIALEDNTLLCAIPVDSLFEVMQVNDSLLKRIVNIASFKMQNDQCVRIATNAQQRIADFLLNFLYRLQERPITKDKKTLPMSQLDISVYLGMAHETVNRILKKFCKDKIISITNKKISIEDIHALERLGNPSRFFGQKAG